MGDLKFHEASGIAGRIIVARVSTGTDIVEGIEEICEKYNIEAAIVSVVIGSLQRAEITYAVPKSDTKMKAGKGEPLCLEGPLDCLSAQGTVGRNEKGERYAHIHAALADKLDHVYGGHLARGKNPVLLTVEVALTEVTGLRLVRRLYEETNTSQLSPEVIE